MLKFFITFLKLISKSLNILIRYLGRKHKFVIIREFYYYFSWIPHFFQIFKFFYLFKLFFKILAFINGLLSLFVISYFTDFNYNFLYSSFIPLFLSDYFFWWLELFKKIQVTLINFLKDHIISMIPLEDSTLLEVPSTPSTLRSNAGGSSGEVANNNFLFYFILFLITGSLTSTYLYWDTIVETSFGGMIQVTFSDMYNGILDYLFNRGSGPGPDTTNLLDMESSPTVSTSTSPVLKGSPS